MTTTDFNNLITDIVTEAEGTTNVDDLSDIDIDMSALFEQLTGDNIWDVASFLVNEVETSAVGSHYIFL